MIPAHRHTAPRALSLYRLGGAVLVVIGLLALVSLPIVSLTLDLRVLHATGGPWMVFLGVTLFPATMIVVPLYAAVVGGDWLPLWISVAAFLVPWLLIAAGSFLLPELNGVPQRADRLWSDLNESLQRVDGD